MSKPITVTINGKKYSALDTMPLSFRDVADIAGFKSPALPTITLHYNHGPLKGRILHPAESVIPCRGMVFNVADTSHA